MTTRVVTIGTLEEMHWEILPHPSYNFDLTPSDSHLFYPLKETLTGKRFRADHEVKFFVQKWLDEQIKFFKGV
jgi:hypothetical protein